MIEVLNTYKNVKGLPQYVNDHIFKVLEKKEDQTVIQIIEGLTKKFGKFWLEKMKEWLDNWLEFRNNEEDDFFFVMKVIGIRKQKLKVTDAEMMALWMLEMAKKR